MIADLMTDLAKHAPNGIPDNNQYSTPTTYNCKVNYAVEKHLIVAERRIMQDTDGKSVEQWLVLIDKYNAIYTNEIEIQLIKEILGVK